VQTAVTVLDKKGNFVEGLQRDQFELMVDGKPRPVTFFERVASGSARERELAALGTPNEPTTTPAAAPRVPGRPIVFFIDDLHLSPDSMNRTRMMLQHFLDQEMSSKDNLAILTASGQVGFLEQFTNNKAVLDMAVSLAKSQLMLSSVLLGGQVLEDKSKAGTPHVQLSVDHSFPRSAQLGYWVFVYNARRDASGNPQLTVQTQVLRDGQPVLSSPQRKVTTAGQDAERIPFGAELALTTLTPGQYDLKVIVTDSIAGTSATQLSDFVVR
jgi:VWFA-related protein